MPVVERSLVNRIALWTIVALLIVGGSWALGRKASSHPSPAAKAKDQPVVETATDRPAGDFVLATVNGEPIYHTDFVLAVQSLPAAAQPIAATASGRHLVLEELVRLKVLKQEAKRQGLDRDPEVAMQLASALDNMLAAAALEKMVSDAPTDLREFYEANTNQFRGTRVRQIVVAYDGGLIPPRHGGRAMSEADAKKKASDIAGRIRGGESFASVAAAESDDPQTAEDGGSLGLVRPGQLGQNLETEIEKLQPNVVSDPIRSPYGFHVFEVTGREVSSFEQVEGALVQQGSQLRAQILMNALRETANVRIEDASFFERAGP
jgi:peptidyl-prolyl cis-trans isomerase C